MRLTAQPKVGWLQLLTFQTRSQWESMPFAEWNYLQNRWRILVLLLSASLSILPVFIDARMIAPPYSSLLGVVTFTFAIAGYWVAGRYQRLGGLLSLTGTWIGVLLAIMWWPFPGASMLLILPVLLATQFLGIRIGSLSALLAAALMFLLSELSPLQAPGERTLCLFLVVTLWCAQLITQSWARELVSILYMDYQKAKSELEAVRDHRLMLNQVNKDLADAYVQLRRLNNLLQASRMEAEAARRAKEEFVANVSHELRTPLNMIIGLSEMIVSSPDSYDESLPPTLLSDVRVIHRNSQHLSRLINDVLDLSQAEAGRLQLHRDWTDPRVLVDETLEVIRPLFQAKGLYLRKEVPEELPPIFCDHVRIRQVLLNLLSNAGRFTAKGGVTIQVTETNNALVFSVADTGPGIPESERERIFEPFHQVQATPGEAWNGSGLGLRISQQFVELHGGKMWVESVLDVGTTFHFSLPYPLNSMRLSGAARWVTPYTAHEPYQKHSTEALPQVPRRIILLDAEEMLARRLEAYLHSTEVVVVRDLAQMKAEIERLPPDMLLVNDVRVMEDKDFIRRAIPLPSRLPVVSCYIPSREDAWKYLNVRDYLVKPLVRQVLLDAVTPLAGENAAILITEDDPDTARLTRRQLVSARRGYRILTANDAATALEIMRSRTIDLLCLDLNLPDQEGYEVLRQKNADEAIRDIPVVIISARDPTGDPIVAGRIRVELAEGLSVRDIVRCVVATDWAFATERPTSAPERREILADSLAFG